MLRGIADGLAIRNGNGHGLLHEDMLAGLGRRDGERRMEVVARGDDHSVHLLVRQHLIHVRRAVCRAVFVRRLLCPRPGAVDHRDQSRARHLGEVGQVEGVGEAARAEDGHTHLPGARRTPPQRQFALYRQGGNSFGLAVGEHRRDRVGLSVQNAGVGLLCARHVTAQRYQGLHLDLPLRQHPEELGHVPPFGPAHVADGIVETLLLIGGVVSAGPVRTRKPEVQFFQVEGFARKVHPHRPGHHDAALLPAQFERRVRDLAVLGGRADQHAIRAVSRGPLLHVSRQVFGSRRHVSAKRRGQLASRRDGIRAQDAATRGTQNLRRQLPQQPHAHHDKGLAKRGGELPASLHRDGAQRHKGGILRVDAVRDGGEKLLGNEIVFRVAGISAARARDAIAGPESSQPFAAFHDGTRGAVAGKLKLEQLIANEVYRAPNADAGDLSFELLHVQGIAGIFHDKRGRAAVRHERRFRPGTDDRMAHTNEGVSRRDTGSRHVFHMHLPPSNQDLLHTALSPPVNGVPGPSQAAAHASVQAARGADNPGCVKSVAGWPRLVNLILQRWISCRQCAITFECTRTSTDEDGFPFLRE